ncbi:MAG TPA: phosphatidylglycerophosphatase A [Acidocella sp.]|jgi:phosphatidylglycerophosphatase A|nr:phosphatidylglycerophosphatase A [Acidocella sp.]
MTIPRLLASGFCAGYAPAAPGTAGSVVGLLIGATLLTAGHLFLVAGILVASMAGLWSIAALNEGQADPGWIVIDEIAGQMIALLALPHVSPAGLVLAFIAFRFFDISKPGPIGWVDGRHDVWGVMGDDWLAGIAAAILLLLIRLVWPL